jgi:soluble lytic murein transglycosylase-like protein
MNYLWRFIVGATLLASMAHEAHASPRHEAPAFSRPAPLREIKDYIAPNISSYQKTGVHRDIAPAILAVKQAAETEGVSESFLAAVCFAESSLDPYKKTIEKDGTISWGLCQLKCETARSVGFHGKCEGLFNPYANALYAARYIRSQCSTLRGTSKVELASACYNAGPGGVVGGRFTNTMHVRHVIEAIPVYWPLELSPAPAIGYRLSLEPVLIKKKIKHMKKTRQIR